MLNTILYLIACYGLYVVAWEVIDKWDSLLWELEIRRVQKKYKESI